MEDKKVLVVYYSRTGTTKDVSKIIKEKLRCSVEEIHDAKNRQGIVGYIKAGREGFKKSMTVIKPIKKDPSMYDLVIIGTPVWAAHISPAIRTYIHENRQKFKNVALFSTQKGSSSNMVYKDVVELIGKIPIATLKLHSKDFKENNYMNKIQDFLKEISVKING
ncbi:flavodoxin [Clostridium liquoris]|jgi:flavodoxin|uniref:Flavodoxin n=1 Tax=Clostridium liquoris TaxID=1289519 RepID=A0A2T0B3B1_9CLOT|nr:hypothetical protein [Clostridium liquoris]PRR78356.1 flavodoxin [Clostridium liquoris]